MLLRKQSMTRTFILATRICSLQMNWMLNGPEIFRALQSLWEIPEQPRKGAHIPVPSKSHYGKWSGEGSNHMKSEFSTLIVHTINCKHNILWYLIIFYYSYHMPSLHITTIWLVAFPGSFQPPARSGYWAKIRQPKRRPSLLLRDSLDPPMSLDEQPLGRQQECSIATVHTWQRSHVPQASCALRWVAENKHTWDRLTLVKCWASPKAIVDYPFCSSKSGIREHLRACEPAKKHTHTHGHVLQLYMKFVYVDTVLR